MDASSKPPGFFSKHKLSAIFSRATATSPLAAVHRRLSAPATVGSQQHQPSPPQQHPKQQRRRTDAVTAIDEEIVFGTNVHALATSRGARKANEDRFRVITSLERFGTGLMLTEKKRVRTFDDALRQHVMESYVIRNDAPAYDAKKLSKHTKHASDTAFYGVYDGHGGAKCSSLLALLLPLYLLRQLDFHADIESAAKRACLEINDEILKREAARECTGGSTAITLLVRRDVAYVCNTGDCRAILVSRRGVQALTNDHKATNEAEKERIEAAGGLVLYVHGVPRVNGRLAVARAFGNSELRDIVIPTPEVTAHRITPDDEYIVMASDGLWDALSNDHVLDCIRYACVGSSE